MKPTAATAILATAEKLARAGATEFEIGPHEDDETKWYAKAMFKGETVEVRDAVGPTEAADAITRRVAEIKLT